MFTIVHWLKKKLPTFLGLPEYNFGEIQDTTQSKKKTTTKISRKLWAWEKLCNSYD